MPRLVNINRTTYVMLAHRRFRDRGSHNIETGYVNPSVFNRTEPRVDIEIRPRSIIPPDPSRYRRSQYNILD